MGVVNIVSVKKYTESTHFLFNSNIRKQDLVWFDSRFSEKMHNSKMPIITLSLRKAALHALH